MVPVTAITSPGLAVARRTIAPWGPVPNAVIETESGPGGRAVSPPSNGQPYRLMSWASPSAKAAIHDSCVLAGNAIDNRNPAGVAPLAARSERFIRSALRAML